MIKLPIAALVVVVALLGGFYGGYKVGGGGTASAANSTNGTTNRSGNAFNGRGAFAACPSASPSASAGASGTARRGATGTLTNLTNNSFTVHDTRCNTTEKVSFDQSVIVRETTVGKASDLQENDTITVTGTRESDGSLKANTITIVPAGSGGGFGGFGGGNGGGGQP